MITLIANDFGTSPYVRKVWIVPRELGLEHDFLRLPLFDLTRAHEAMQPSVRVSVPMDGERRLFDSNVIVA